MSTNHTSDLPQGDVSEVEGQAPAVDGLVEQETGGETVQVAQAGSTASDGARPIEVVPGAEIDLSDISLDGSTMTLDGQDLILTLADGTVILLQDFITASLSDNPPTFLFGGDLQMSAADMLANSSPAAGGELPPGVNPQAGTPGTSDDDGTTVAPEAQGPIGPGAEPTGPLGPTSLAFSAPEPDLGVVFLESPEAGITVSVFDADPVFEPSSSDGGGGGGGEGDGGPFAVTTSDDGALLAQTILGPGISIVPGSIVYTGAANASGTFTGGGSAGIGIGSGLIMTSGNANLALGPNTQDGATGSNGTPGDSDLNALIPQSTQDASVLEFDFQSAGGDLFFSFVFASEEYNEYTNSGFNDVFAFFLDGENVALIPGTNTPVSINNVNGGNPFGTNASNPDLFNNNDLQDGGPFFNIEYDGFTDVFTVTALDIGAGEHHIKLAIADAGDSLLDSAIFIQAGSFSDQPTGTFAVFPIRLSEASDVPVTVAYQTVDGTATAGEDYVFTSGTVTFAPGETELFVKVAVLSDEVIEGTENFTLELTSADGATIAIPTGLGTILDLEVCPEITCEQLFTDYMAAWNGPVSGKISPDDIPQEPDSVSDEFEEGTAGEDFLEGVAEFDFQLIVGHGDDDWIIASSEGDFNIVHGDTPDGLDIFNNKPSLLVSEGEPDFGEPGNDVIFGADNPDGLEILIGGEGNDYLDGQAGGELIVGDELAVSLSFGEGNLPKDQIALAAVPSGGGDYWLGASSLYASDPYASGDNYNDVLFSGQGQAIMVGDVAATGLSDDGDSFKVGYNGQISLYASFADGGTVTAYNDFIKAEDPVFGTTPDLPTDLLVLASEEGDLPFGPYYNYMVGDVLAVGSVAYGSNLSTYGEGGTGSAYTFNDYLCGADGADLMVGDLVQAGWFTFDQLISLRVSGDNSTSDQTFESHNDILLGHGGDDHMVGDVYTTGIHSSDINLNVDNNASAYSGNANGNSYDAFNDQFRPGLGHDTTVGDVHVDGFGNTIDLFASNDASGAGYYGEGGASADDNTFFAYNDEICDDGGAVAIGDVYAEGNDNHVTLAASNTASGSYGEGNTASDNTFTVFSDIVHGDEEFEGADGDYGEGSLLVGDVYVKNPYGDESAGDVSLSVENKADGWNGYSGEYGADGGQANNNTFNAFNDTLVGGMNSYYEMGYEVPPLTTLAVSEVSESKDPGDTLVGDVLFDSKESSGVPDINLKVENAAGANFSGSVSSYGEGGTADINTFNAFNDTLVGGADEGPEEPISVGEGDFFDLILEQNTLVGDVMAEDAGNINLTVGNAANEDVSGVYNPPSSASNNAFHAFNDSITLGYGEGTLVGDVYAQGDCGKGGLQIQMAASNHAGYASAATDNTFDVFNDTLVGDAFDDSLVGDVHIWGGALDRLEMRLENSTYNDGDKNTGQSDASRTTFDAFNDDLTGGDGSNQLVGDVFFAGYENCETGIELSALGTYGTVGEGDDEFSDKFTAWNDSIVGGADYDKMVGDLKIGNSNGLINTAIMAGAAYKGAYSYADGTYDLFNDTMDGGGDSDDMVGDIWTWGDGNMRISAIGEDVSGADNDGQASFTMFHDDMTGGDGGDWMVGDMYFHDFGLDSASTVDVLAYGEGTFNMFNDDMDGGVGSDVMIGDIHFANFGGYGEGQEGPSDDVFRVDVNHASGGKDDFSLFNDTMDGGDDDDHMVGDVLFDEFDAKFEVNIENYSEGSGEGSITLFSDTMTGGDGEDALFGDFFFGDEGDLRTFDFGEESDDFLFTFDADPTNPALGDIEFVFTVDSDFAGSDVDISMFNDILVGGAGDDNLIGQLGSDELEGGAGADTFWYSAGDGDNPSANGMFNGNDDVSDLEDVIVEGDVINDYEAGVDAIGLYGGLTESDLDYTQLGANVRIEIESSGEILATVLNATSSDLDFVEVL